VAFDLTTWGANTAPKDSIGKMIENFRALKEDGIVTLRPLLSSDIPKTLDHTWMTDFASQVISIMGSTANAGTTANTIPIRDSSGNLPGNILGNAATATTCSGNAATATALANARAISISGDGAGTANFDGSANATIGLTLASVGTLGTYTKVTTDAKGRVVSGTTLSSSDIPKTLDHTWMTDFASQVTSIIGSTANAGTVASTIPIRDSSGNLPGNILGNAATATKLAAGVTLATSGDAAGSASFDGSANATIALTLATVNSPGTYTKVTTNAKGLVTSGTTLSNTDVPKTLDSSWLTDFATKVATLLSGTATTLATPRAIAISGDGTGTINFDGSAGVSIPLTLATVNTSGAGTYTKLTVNGKGLVTSATTLSSSDVPKTLDSSWLTDFSTKVATLLSGTATKLATARNINSVLFDGSADITITAAANGGNSATVGGYTPGNANGNVPVSNGTINTNLNAQYLNGIASTGFAPSGYGIGTNAATFSADYNTMVTTGFFQSTATTQTNAPNASELFTLDVVAASATNVAQYATGITTGKMYSRNNVAGTWQGWLQAANTTSSITGNAATATKLAATKNINGVAFDGSADITITAAANGGNAATLGGLSQTSAATASTVVARDASGYIFGVYLNQSSAVENTAAANYWYDTGDGYLRKKSLANAKIELGGSSAPHGNQMFTGSGTFTTPSGTSTSTVYWITLSGGGGGGSGDHYSNPAYVNGCGGGGAAAYISYAVTGIAANTAVTITVGAAGSGGAYAGNGGTGGTSSFGAYLSAAGGGGATTTAAGASGGAGGGAGIGSTGGSSIFGVGYPANGLINSTTGCGYGAGGSGSSYNAANGTGGAGTAGFVLVEW